MSDLTSHRFKAGEFVLSWVAVNDNEFTNTLLWLPAREFYELPEELQERFVDRVQRRPTQEPRFAIPARVLTNYAIGFGLPRKEDE